LSITNNEITQNSKSEPKKFSILCTFNLRIRVKNGPSPESRKEAGERGSGGGKELVVRRLQYPRKPEYELVRKNTSSRPENERQIADRESEGEKKEIFYVSFALYGSL
jgi:hypothetical protein